MRRRSSGDIWFFLILFFIFGGTGFIPLLFIAGMVFLIMHYVLKNSGQDQAASNRATYSYGYNERRQGNVHTASDLAKINVFLRKYFRSNTRLNMPNDIQLLVRTGKYNTLSNLDVYRSGTRIGTLNEFRSRYGDLYDSMFDTLLAMANNSYTAPKQEIIEAEIVEQPTVQVKQEKRAEEKKKAEPKKEEKRAQYFIEQINDLNNNIPDEEISNGLYETAALLKQVDILEKKFPDSAVKMNKMYEYYLPYMTKILNHYENIQTVKSDINYERNVEQLKSTIRSINEALNNIIPSMSDSDFTNLSADMATLEALLQKDGLTGGMDMSRPYSK